MFSHKYLFLVVLLAGAFWLSLLPDQRLSETDDVSDDSDNTISDERTEFIARRSSRPAGSSYDPVRNENRDVFREAVLAELDNLKTVELQRAVKNEVESEFAGFFDRLELNSEDERVIRSVLEDSYIDIRLVASAMEQGKLEESEIFSLRNPNHVLDALSLVLDADQLITLEETLEQRARQSFDLVYTSRDQVVLQQLGSESRALILDTLFRESYALTSPDGIALTAGVADTLDRQLEAIRITRTALGGRFSEAESEVVGRFLDQQEKALAAAAIVFDW